MGLSYLAFACPVEELESVYSSRDEALYTKLVTSEVRAIRHYLHLDREHAPAIGEWPQHLAPLRDLFVGASLTLHEPHQYGYALIACLYALGTYLGESGGGYGRQAEASIALHEMGESDELLPDMSVDWPIPNMPSVEDWPMYLGLPAADVERRAAGMKSLLARISPGHHGRMPERAARFLDDFDGFYEKCAALKQDLIVVSH
jgi:hypothetical protein